MVALSLFIISAKHKREMASLKNQQVDISGNFATKNELERLQAQLDEVSAHVNAHQGSGGAKAQHEKKKGKKNKAKEEL